MAKKMYPSNVVELAQDVLVGWGQVDTDLTFGGGSVTTDTLRADISAALPMEAEISNLEKLLSDKREERDILYFTIWDKVKRVRAGVKANYGDDSRQYEKVGGTRISEKKPRARKGSASTTVQ